MFIDKTKLKIDEFSKHCEPRNKPKTGIIVKKFKVYKLLKKNFK